MKIAHISDIHLGHRDSAFSSETLLTSLCALPEEIRTVVITGDLLDNGSKPEQLQMGVDFIRRLESNGKEVKLVPGNHDYGSGIKLDKEALKRFNNTFFDKIRGKGTAPVHVSNGHEPEVWFIGLDSSAEELGFFTSFFAEGVIGEAQLNMLDLILKAIHSTGEQNQRVVLLLHHNPFIDGYMVRPDVGDKGFLGNLLRWKSRHWLRLKDASSLLDIIRDRVDILLFGHQHNYLNYSSPAQAYGIKVALDGSSTTGVNRNRRHLSYRIIDTKTFEVTTVAF